MDRMALKLLDMKQKSMAKKLEQALTEKLREAYTIEVGNCNLGYEAQRGFAIYIYDNQYDFKRLDLKFLLEATVDDYTIAVTNAIIHNKWTKEHKACKMEKMLAGLLSELKNIWLHESTIYWTGNEFEGVWIDDIVNYTINTGYNELILELTDNYFFKIDLETGEVSEIKDRIEELTEQIKLLNELKPYNSDVKIVDGWVSIRYGDDERYMFIGKIDKLRSIDIENITFNFTEETVYINQHGIEM